MGNKEAREHLISADSRLKKVIESVGELQIYRYGSSDVFIFLVREIVGQMISLGVKKLIFQRLLDLCNNNITPETLNNLTVEQFHEMGLSNAKSNYILNLVHFLGNANKWKPYQSIVAIYMYQALGRGLTKVPLEEFLE